MCQIKLKKTLQRLQSISALICDTVQEKSGKIAKRYETPAGTFILYFMHKYK
jgi:hypothetical protein